MEHSAGAIIKNKEGKFLVIKGKNGAWGFPKGHIEKGENIIDTLHREIKEEVGLEVTLTDITQFIEHKLENGSMKRITFFLAYLKFGEVTPNSEIKDFKWLTKEEVIKILSFEDLRKLFEDIVDKYP